MSAGILKQLDPPIPLVTPLGSAQAHFIWVDIEQDILYGVFQDETGENWWFPNHKVRLQTNITRGHSTISPIGDVEGLNAHRKRYKGTRS